MPCPTRTTRSPRWFSMRSLSTLADTEGRHPPPDLQDRARPGALWLRLQEEGRAGPRGRRRRLSPLAPRHPPATEATEIGTEVKIDVPTRRAISRSSVRWHSSSGPTRSSASWCSSASIAASSRRAIPFTIRAPASANASAASWSSRAANARTSTRCIPATSPRSSACGTSPRATRSATKTLTSPSSRRLFPEPVISMAIEPKTKQDRDKMSEGLQRLSEEDPTFHVFTSEETGQLIIAGMGELHLEIIRDRLKLRVQGRSRRRRAADRLPRNHHQGGRW